jgi:hypothetical protein
VRESKKGGRRINRGKGRRRRETERESKKGGRRINRGKGRKERIKKRGKEN